MLKKLLLVAAAAMVFRFWGDINPTSTGSQPDLSAAHDTKVVLYATSWCGYCAKARQLLEKNNVDYIEYDIEKSAEGKRQHQSLGGGGIPVLLINGEVVRGYNRSRILELTKST